MEEVRRNKKNEGNEIFFSFFFCVCVGHSVESAVRDGGDKRSSFVFVFFFFLLKHFLLFDRFPRLRFLWLPFFFSFFFLFTFGHRRVVHLCVGQRNEKGTETSSGSSSSSSSSSFFSLSSFFFFFFLVFFLGGGIPPPLFFAAADFRHRRRNPTISTFFVFVLKNSTKNVH